MSRIIENRKLSEEYYIIKVAQKSETKPGQFFMVRTKNNEPLLSRPLSIYDCDSETLSFLYRLRGRGTNAMAELKPGEELIVEGPYGKSFPKVKGKIALIGGGVGIAPLYLCAKKLKEDENNIVDVFFSLRGEEILREEFEKVSDHLDLKANARVTQDVDYDSYDYIFTCGPDSMMEDVYKNSEGTKAQVYISVERRMGCGIGICYVCTCKTKSGNVLACKDGPVFKGDEFYD